jgi:hypothetical protein
MLPIALAGRWPAETRARPMVALHATGSADPRPNATYRKLILIGHRGLLAKKAASSVTGSATGASPTGQPGTVCASRWRVRLSSTGLRPVAARGLDRGRKGAGSPG